MNRNTVYPFISLKVFKENGSEIKMPLGIYHGYNDCFCQKMNEKINKNTTLMDIFEICLNDQECLKKCEIYFSYIKIIARTFSEYINDSPYKKIFESISKL